MIFCDIKNNFQPKNVNIMRKVLIYITLPRTIGIGEEVFVKCKKYDMLQPWQVFHTLIQFLWDHHCP